jgi:hypothetical protein
MQLKAIPTAPRTDIGPLEINIWLSQSRASLSLVIIALSSLLYRFLSRNGIYAIVQAIPPSLRKHLMERRTITKLRAIQLIVKWLK